MKIHTYRAMMACILVGAMTVCRTAQAATYYWDTDGITGGFGNTAGTWGTSAFWSADITGASATVLTTITTGDGVNFGTATLALSAASTNVGVAASGVTVNSITFGAGQTTPIVLGTVGNTITLGGTTPTITVNNTADTISSIIAVGPLTKAGTGTLTLSGNNTYSGATTISAGTLKAGSTTGLSANSAFSVNGGVLDLNGFNTTVANLGVGNSAGTISNSASGSGTNTLTLSAFSANLATLITDGTTAKTALVVGGGQSVPWIANANNTFSGGLTINSLSSTRIYQLAGMTTTLNGDGSIQKSNFGTGTVTIGTTTGGAQLAITSANQQIYNPMVFNAGPNAYADGGKAAFRADTTGIKLYGKLTANLSPVSFCSGGTGSVTAQGQITGPNGVWLNAGNITLTLSNTNATLVNNYVGATTIQPSTTLALGAADQIPNGPGKGNLSNRGTFKLGGFSETINGLSGSGIVDGVSGTPTLTIGDNDATGTTNTFSGVIKNTAGVLTLTKIGSGEMTLSGTNTYSGATIISNGTLKLGGVFVLVANSSFESPVMATGFYQSTTPDSWALSSGVGITAGNSTTFNPTGTEPDGNQAAFTKGATGVTSWLGQSNITFGVSSTYRISFSAVCRDSPYVTPLAVMLDSTVVGTVNPGYTAWSNFELLSYVTAGAHSLVFSNTVTGDKSVNIDKVLVSEVTPSGSYNIPYRSPISIAAGAIFDLAGVSQPVASLSDAVGGGYVTNSTGLSAVLTLNADAGSTGFSGLLSGRIGLVKTGTGTQTLSGMSGFSQGTIISNGTLLVNGGITGAVMVAGGILGGTGVVAGTVTNRATLAAAGTNAIGVLTVTNLVMAENATVAWDFNASTQDLIRVTGALTLPTVATVNVSRVSSGIQPTRAALFTFGSGPTPGKLNGWIITGARGGTYAEVRGNDVVLKYPTGTMISLF
jgi:autotransporter-associated beta strand protein